MDGDTFEMRMQCRGVVAFSMSTAILKLLLFPFFSNLELLVSHFRQSKDASRIFLDV